MHQAIMTDWIRRFVPGLPYKLLMWDLTVLAAITSISASQLQEEMLARVLAMALNLEIVENQIASTVVKSIKSGSRRLVDRSDRGDLKIFQIDWRMVNAG